MVNWTSWGDGDARRNMYNKQKKNKALRSWYAISSYYNAKFLHKAFYFQPFESVTTCVKQQVKIWLRTRQNEYIESGLLKLLNNGLA